jgi:signal transduction histidine kinase
LSNIIKHADATEVIIELLHRDNQVILHIHDNGKGFEIGKVKEGIGLNNIRLRAEALDGKVSIQSAPGKGSNLEINLPVFNKVIV